MGYQNPPIRWSELERRLSARRPESHGGRPAEADGGDSPAWSQNRGPYVAPGDDGRPRRPDGPVTPYAELHVHSNFSFLDGASSPEQLVEEAVRHGLHAIALTDHDGFYGAARFAETADAYAMPTVYGAELSLGLPGPQNGVADPDGSHLLVLAEGKEGYHRLAGAMTEAHLAGGEKGRPVYDLEELAARGRDHWLILTGCRKGAVRQALTTASSPAAGAAAARRELDRLTALFGRDRVVVELIDHRMPLSSTHNQALADLAAAAGLPTVATGNVHYAQPRDHRLASALAAVRARRSLDEMDGWLPAGPAAFLHSGAEMAMKFRNFPGAVARSVELADQLAFRLRAAQPRLPKIDVPAGLTQMGWLRQLVFEGAAERYGTRDQRPDAYQRLERELDVIEQRDFPGYFLIVWDMVRYAREHGILCQGRGSAANSAVVYCLGVTAVDSILYGLPFERFLAATRSEEPDIDVDFDSDRREEVIQYMYGKYGRRNAAQVANVISYRPKMAVRDMAKALGYSTGQQDAWSKQVDGWSADLSSTDHDIPPLVVEMATELLKAPRHLGIHSGGMVLTEQPVGEVVPIEHARMEKRTVLQWDKDDCAYMGLVKFDMLGLGMLAAIQYCIDLVADRLGERWQLHTIPKEEQGVYDQLCRADSVGVFQVESRAQMATLPRLRPRRFYDLACEIALIRPGPIQGGAVHPFVRRMTGQEPITYPHPLLEPVLERTKGVPLFQEQLMQMAMAIGGIDGDEADLLRRAMGSKRGIEKISSLKTKLYAGMATNGLTGDVADDIYARIEAFANFGFAESHSISFALLVYASTWFRLHYPAAFLAALLRAQPMGFYSPQSLVADARRHGVEVRRPDLQRSGVHALLEDLDDRRPARPTGMDSCLATVQPPIGPFDPDAPDTCADHRRDGAFAVRLGLAAVKSIGTTMAETIVEQRELHGPYADLADLARRTGLTASQLEALATAGAFDCFGIDRRQALWQAGRAAEERPDRFAGITAAGPPPMLPGMGEDEVTVADLWATGITTGKHPVEHVRAQLDAAGILSATALRTARPDTRVTAAGVVTHRQRPATASGVTFLNLEDETGMINVIVSPGCWARHRKVARTAAAMIIHGRLERANGVTNLVAERIERLPLTARTTSRDFR
ncbi:DNA polymerase III, alpha subunit [Kribbella flavida DSM 17836]|uniref:Error-prone DNA polymerase n=1 Tax=Kribbella flavida (strain DSM 17836 / JCM 10339 / NBRC 14399) TaxID=479435 RepID=D2PR76_KRIFD|nr:error-prone DNA polymerase [Kribbella flavida]ADB33024.1 DNA polymerase III, alpha subunit [Kribbella flavida DSM 17836]